MAKIDDSLTLASGSALVVGRPADDALLGLLASMACSDGEVHNAELAFLGKVRGDLQGDDLLAWAREHAAPVDYDALAAVITTADDRWKTLRFAARMAWKDNELATEERELLTKLASVLKLGSDAVERVLKEMRPHAESRFHPDRILRTLMDIRWDAVQLASGTLCSEDLIAVTPNDTKVVARVGLERVEIMGFCVDGVVARFQEGAAFLHWSELVTYTRDRGLGSSVKLHTEDGRSYTLVDQRLMGVCAFLDRLLDDRERATKKAPVISRVRGED